MRVLVTADTVGGVWTYTRELVTYLSEGGHEVVLVSFGGAPAPAQTQWLGRLRKVEYFPTEFRLEWMQDCAADLASSAELLLRLIDEKQPDLLHLSQYCYGALPTDLPKIVIAHSDVVSWWVAVHGREPAGEQWIDEYREVVERGIAGADAVAGVSHWMLEQIGTHYAKPRRSMVVYNGRSGRMFDRDRGKELRALSVGRLWDRAKQTSLLADAAGEMPITIAGETEHPEGGAARREMSEGVEFLGKQSEEELRELYARCAVYAGTSCYEPFGLAPLEAALSGCALLLNDIPTFREVWGESALYFERNSAASLKAGLQSLRDDDALRADYAKRAGTHALQSYTAERMGAEYVQLYEALAGVRELVG